MLILLLNTDLRSLFGSATRFGGSGAVGAVSYTRLRCFETKTESGAKSIIGHDMEGISFG